MLASADGRQQRDLVALRDGRILTDDEGRPAPWAVEVLSEELCHAWAQGYTETGRHALVATYEAFAPITLSLIQQQLKHRAVRQHAGLAPLPSLVYFLTSLGWHNTLTHQNPSLTTALLASGDPTLHVLTPADPARTAAGLTFGSETSGGIRNIEAYRLRAEHPVPVGLLFKSAKTRGGVISGIDLHDITLSYVRTALMINLNWNPSYSYAQIPANIDTVPDYWKVLATPVPPSRGIPSLEDVAISDFRAIGANIGFAVQAYPEKPLRDFRFDRLDLDVKEAGAIANAVDWRFTEARLTGLDGSPPVLTDSSRIVGLLSAT